MTNMSYCMFENTKQDINQILNAFQEGEVDLEDMSTYELSAFKSIADSARELADEVDNLLEETE